MSVKINGNLLGEVIDTKAEKIFGKAMFQRRHYEMIGDILASIEDKSVRLSMMQKFSAMFAEDNKLYHFRTFAERCFPRTSKTKIGYGKDARYVK